jgi:hypothetical protein
MRWRGLLPMSARVFVGVNVPQIHGDLVNVSSSSREQFMGSGEVVTHGHPEIMRRPA